MFAPSSVPTVTAPFKATSDQNGVRNNDRARAAADPLEDRHRGEEVVAAASPRGRNEQALEAEAGTGLPALAGEHPLAIAVGRPRGQFRGREPLRGAAETQVVIGPLEVHAPSPSSCRGTTLRPR